VNPGRSGSPRARCSKFCSKSTADLHRRLAAARSQQCERHQSSGRAAQRWCGTICGFSDCVSDIRASKQRLAVWLMLPKRLLWHTIMAILPSLPAPLLRRGSGSRLSPRNRSVG
jgi:hypothetical protein